MSDTKAKREKEPCPQCRELELRVLKLTSVLRDAETYLKIIASNAGIALRGSTGCLDEGGVAIASIEDKEEKSNV